MGYYRGEWKKNLLEKTSKFEAGNIDFGFDAGFILKWC